MIYEVLQDIDVRRNSGFVHYYGRRHGHRGQLVSDASISAEDLEWLRSADVLKVIIESKPELKPDFKTKKKDRFGNEIYYCQKCKGNHRKESKIGIAHGDNVL